MKPSLDSRSSRVHPTEENTSSVPIVDIREKWVHNGEVRLHVLDCNERSHPADQIPIVFIPGISGIAQDYLPEMATMSPRRSLSISLRGRGNSSAPEKGYGFEDHVSDITSVIERLDLSGFCLCGFSIGASFAMGYAVDYPMKLAGMIILDYPARFPSKHPDSDWLEYALSNPPDRFSPVAARAFEKTMSNDVLLWDKLNRLPFPVLVVRGGKPGAMLKAEEAEMYRSRLKDVEVLCFEESDYMVWKPDYIRYLNTLKTFLDKLDAAGKKVPPRQNAAWSI